MNGLVSNLKYKPLGVDDYDKTTATHHVLRVIWCSITEVRITA